jgi:hypothetical protein
MTDTTAPRYVQPHDNDLSTRPRRALAKVLAAVGVWFLLPGRVQGAVCNCPIDRGEG